MEDLVTIYDSVLEHRDDVVRQWERHVDDAPWLGLPPKARIDHIPEMLEAIVQALKATPNVHGTRESAIRLGILHGRHRREHGFDDAVLHHEHHLLRAAVWDVIREWHGRSDNCFEAIARFDVVLTHTTSASLQGYHIGYGSPPLTEQRIVEKLTADDQPWPPPPAR